MTDRPDQDRNLLEEEGVPDLYDAVSEDDGMVPPSDQPRFVDAVGVTAAEERAGETLAERVLQEEPERFVSPERPVGRLVEHGDATGGLDDTEVYVEDSDDTTALSAEEAAMHVEEASGY
jgi:hypothetical protein